MFAGCIETIDRWRDRGSLDVVFLPFRSGATTSLSLVFKQVNSLRGVGREEPRGILLEGLDVT
jgi:hypothetical protein